MSLEGTDLETTTAADGTHTINGVPDPVTLPCLQAKATVFAEMYRVLRPGGRLQIGDISVDTAVPDEAKKNLDLWTG